MTDLSPSRPTHLRRNAQIYGDEVVVEILDALDAAVAERDELRDAPSPTSSPRNPTRRPTDPRIP